MRAVRETAVGHHDDRLAIARAFGATDLVPSGDEDAARQVKEMNRVGANHVRR